MAEILLVQDSPARAVELRILLEQRSHRVKHAGNGKDALSILQKHPIDLVLADLHLKEMNGAELVEAVQAQFPDVVVILITPSHAETLADQALRAGAAGFIPQNHLQMLLNDTVETALRVLASDESFGELVGSLQENSFVFDLPNDSRLILPLVGLLMQMAAGMRLLPASERVRLGTALQHALVNAMYRGNLGLGPSVTPGHYAIVHRNATTDLIEKRKQEEPYKNRRTHVKATASKSELRITVIDGGHGFNVENFFDAQTHVRFDKEAGHGLVLMERLTDELEFNLSGNEVTLVKNARPF
ncbi:MAG: response regulator [Rubripirellula sp.]|nr:response regulator [Rubripirellula sp.]